MRLIWLALLLCLFCSEATAQEPENPHWVESRRVFRDAERYFQQGNYALAVTTFERSYELLEGHPRRAELLYNIAVAYEELGQYQRAIDSYRRFLEGARSDVPYRAESQQRMQELEARLALQSSGQATSAPAREESGDAGLSPVGPILLGSAGALVIVGLVLGGVALGSADAIRAECPTLEGCDESLRGRHDEMRSLSAASDALWIGGAAVAAVGLVLTLTLTEDGAEASARCGPDGCGAHVRGRF